jgi:hypothetical protein
VLLLRPPVITPDKATDHCNGFKEEDSEEGYVSISCTAAPSVVIKELQRFGAFMAGREIMREKPVKGAVRFSEYRDYYHGTVKEADRVSMVDQIIAGKGIFAGLYDKEDLNNYVATNAGRSAGPCSCP